MLPKKFRLPLKTEYSRIKKAGHYLNGQLTTILYSFSSLCHPRFGFIVSNKISNNACKRNRIKRLLRQATYSLILEIKKPIDGIIIARKEIIDKKLNEIRNNIAGLLKKIEKYEEIITKKH